MAINWWGKFTLFFLVFLAIILLILIVVIFNLDVLVPIILWLIIALLPIYGNARGRVNAKGQTVVKYSLGIRIFVAICIGFFLGIVATAIYWGIPNVSDYQNLPYYLVFASPFVGFALNFNLTWYGLDADGIEWHNPFRRRRRIRWDQVEKIEFNSGPGITIFGDGRKMALTFFLDGMPELARSIKEHVPLERRKKIEKWLGS